MIYLTVLQILEIHENMIDRYGGLKGVRDNNLLLSALDAPKTAIFGMEMYPNVYEKAAVYLYHLVSNHAFNDGNKRTGFFAPLLFLDLNDVFFEFDKVALENLVD